MCQETGRGQGAMSGDEGRIEEKWCQEAPVAPAALGALVIGGM
jgi:hypothetical protein